MVRKRTNLSVCKKHERFIGSIINICFNNNIFKKYTIIIKNEDYL